MKSTSTITSKGQITVPKFIREKLGLKEGDQIVFLLEEGRAYLYPVHTAPIESLRGIFGGKRPYPGREAEREAAKQAAIANALGRQDTAS